MLTEEWLDVFEQSKREGEDLASSVFWILAVHILPEGINADDPRVKKTLEEINEAINARESNSGDSK